MPVIAVSDLQNCLSAANPVPPVSRRHWVVGVLDHVQNGLEDRAATVCLEIVEKGQISASQEKLRLQDGTREVRLHVAVRGIIRQQVASVTTSRTPPGFLRYRSAGSNTQSCLISTDGVGHVAV